MKEQTFDWQALCCDAPLHLPGPYEPSLRPISSLGTPALWNAVSLVSAHPSEKDLFHLAPGQSLEDMIEAKCPQL